MQERRVLASLRARPAAHTRLLFAAVAAAVVSVDQLAKWWALEALADGPTDVTGFFRLRLVFNDGAAFSVGSGNTTLIALIGAAVAAVVIHLGLRADRRMTAVGLGMVLGGALGNLSDRALRAGEGFLGGRVVDMFDLRWWPVFNVADAALSVGIVILLVGSRAERPTSS